MRRQQRGQRPGRGAAGSPAQGQTGEHDHGAGDRGPRAEGDVLDPEQSEGSRRAQVHRQQGRARGGEGLLRRAQPPPRRPGRGGAEGGGDREHDPGLEDQAEAAPCDRDERDGRRHDQQGAQSEQHVLRAQPPSGPGGGRALRPRGRGRRQRGRGICWSGRRGRGEGHPGRRQGLRLRPRHVGRRRYARSSSAQRGQQGVPVAGQVGQRRADPGHDEGGLRGCGEPAGGARPGPGVAHRPAAHRTRRRPGPLLRCHGGILALRPTERGGSAPGHARAGDAADIPPDTLGGRPGGRLPWAQ